MSAAATLPLQRYLRVLWDIAPPLQLEGETPRLAEGGIVLPAALAWPQQRAAAAHAGAHLVFSPPRFDGRGLKPLVRALVGLLEDARVEALAGRELPGLRRLWAAQHHASPADGDSVPGLLGRLARALADPAYADPHPWIAKGRALFFADVAGEVLALGDPAGLRLAASRLGHDLGQTRLGFDARAHRPVPAYRDDNAWMWPAEVALEEQPRPQPSQGDTAAAGPTPPQRPDDHLPEWDHLIGRLRPDWVALFEQPVAAADAALPASDEHLQQAVQRALQMAPPQRERRGLDDSGDDLDTDALVRLRLAQHLRQAPDTRIHPRHTKRRRPGRVLLLVDRSVSSGDVLPGGGTVLARSLQAAALLARALDARGSTTALYAFASEGRAALRLARLKGPAEPHDAALLQRRLAGLQPGGSTRLGAVLRGALRRLGRAAAHEAPPTVLLIGDGRPHDIDVHDPRYLPADTRHALAQARRQGVRVLGLIVDPAEDGSVRRLLGTASTTSLRAEADLPRAVARLRL